MPDSDCLFFECRVSLVLLQLNCYIYRIPFEYLVFFTLCVRLRHVCQGFNLYLIIICIMNKHCINIILCNFTLLIGHDDDKFSTIPLPWEFDSKRSRLSYDTSFCSQWVLQHHCWLWQPNSQWSREEEEEEKSPPTRKWKPKKYFSFLKKSLEDSFWAMADFVERVNGVQNRAKLCSSL